MFKDLYKEANDQIPVNTELLEQLKKEAKHPTKKPFAAIYKYGFAAAALHIVTVSLNALPVMQQNAKKEAADTAISENNTPYKASEHSGSDISPNTDLNNADSASNELISQNAEDKKDTLLKKKISTTSANASVPSASKHSVNNKQCVSPNHEQNSDETVSRTHTTIENNPYMEQANESFAENSNAQNSEQSDEKLQYYTPYSESGSNAADTSTYSDESDKASNGGRSSGGGSSKHPSADNVIASDAGNVASFANISEKQKSDGDTTFLSLSEYSAYFRFADIEIPKNMKITSGNNIMINVNSETGDIYQKEHSVKYADANSSIEITYKFDTTAAAEKIAAADGELYIKNCLIATTPNGFTAYIVSGDKGYIIEFTNLDKKTVYSVINSIL